MAGTRQRSPEEIRASIEVHRRELGEAVARLRVDVERASDWRAQILLHQREVMIGAAVAGFILGGGIAAITGIFRRGGDEPAPRRGRPGGRRAYDPPRAR